MSFLRAAGDVIGFIVTCVAIIVGRIATTFVPSRYRMKSVAGEIVLVTGGGSGIGRLLALRFANLGAVVVVWDINKVGIEETVKLVMAAGGTCYGYECNVCDRKDVYKKAAMVQAEVGKVTILVNNAGVVTTKKFLETPDEMILRTMEVNVMSHFWTAKAFLPAMMESNKGHICSIASLAGHVGIAKLVDYCTSKFAAVGFDEGIRMELECGGYDIHTTVVCPFFIRGTGMFNAVKARFIPSLSASDVAESIVTGIRCNEKYVMIPSFMRILLAAKWLFPWACVSMFLRALVPDVGLTSDEEEPASKNETNKVEISNIMSKEQNGGPVHQQLPRRISSSERKP